MDDAIKIVWLDSLTQLLLFGIHFLFDSSFSKSVLCQGYNQLISVLPCR